MTKFNFPDPTGAKTKCATALEAVDDIAATAAYVKKKNEEISSLTDTANTLPAVQANLEVLEAKLTALVEPLTEVLTQTKSWASQAEAALEATRLA